MTLTEERTDCLVAEVKKQVKRELEYDRLGALQAHQEYELTKRKWYER